MKWPHVTALVLLATTRAASAEEATSAGLAEESVKIELGASFIPLDVGGYSGFPPGRYKVDDSVASALGVSLDVGARFKFLVGRAIFEFVQPRSDAGHYLSADGMSQVRALVSGGVASRHFSVALEAGWALFHLDEATWNTPSAGLTVGFRAPIGASPFDFVLEASAHGEPTSTNHADGGNHPLSHASVFLLRVGARYRLE